MLLLGSSARFPIIVVALLSACVSPAYSQSPWDYVLNLPYTAHIVQTSVQTLADGTQERTKEKIIKMRDSSGRTRIAIFSAADANCDSCDDKPNMVNLYIPLRRQFIQLMPGSKRATVTTFPGTGPIPTHAKSGTDVTTVKENLPAKTINGVYATGTRIKTIIPSSNGEKVETPYFGEQWASPELKIIILDRHVSTHGDETISEVTQLDRSEPDPALFEIPADYKVVNLTDGQDPDSYNSQH
jgi:hypothetical protein